MGQRASQVGELRFDDVYLPMNALLGERNRGFYIMMSVLEKGRNRHRRARSRDCASRIGGISRIRSRKAPIRPTHPRKSGPAMDARRYGKGYRRGAGAR
jgi:hypothetical protein